MDIENLIKDTFTEHERDAPDGAEVLAGARKRIDSRRTTRPLVAGAGVVVLALAAVTIVGLTRSADQAPTASGQGGTVPVGAPAKPAKAGLAMPFSLGWLPSGTVDYLARRINIGSAGSGSPTDKPLYDGEYMVKVKQGKQVLDVDVQEMKMASPGDAMFKSGPGKAVTIDGRKGVESANSGGPGGYELYLTHPSTTGSVYVNVAADPGSTASVEQLVDTGHKVAAHLEFPGTTTVTPVFGLGDLPNGLKMCAFDLEQADATAYELGAGCAAMPNISVNIADKAQVDGKPGKTVQGHETRYSQQNNYGVLYILDAVRGAPIVVQGPLPSTDVYAIANGLVLPG